jgi:dihydroflavonol-4-reductase
MALLVTGSTGYLGGRLLESVRRYPLPSDPPVLALVRPTSSDRIRIERILDRPSEEPFTPVRIGSVLDPVSLRSAVRGISQCVHLAAIMDFFPKDPSLLVRTNVEGTRSLLDACMAEAKETGTRIRFVYISTTEAIGPTDRLQGRGANEEDETTPDSDYGRSKEMAEEIVRSTGYSKYLDTVILRPTGIYGEGDKYFLYELVMAVEAGLFFVAPGPLSGSLMMSHVDDVVSSIRLALTSPAAVGETFIVCPDEANTYREIVEVLARVMNRPRPMATVPLPIAKKYVEILSPLLNWGRSRVFLWHPKSLSQTTTKRVYSNERIKNELGYKPRDSMEGLATSIQHDIASGLLQRRSVSPFVSSSVVVISLATFLLTRLSMARLARNDDDA